MTRYARQIVLPQVGEAGQGRLTIVDGDRVEETNLHRQPLYRSDQAGAPKAQAAAAAARALNPEVTSVALACWLDGANAAGLVAQADVVLDCADTFAVSLTLSDECRVQGKPLVSASALGLSGYVGGFCAGAPSLRAVFPDLPDRAASCATAGVLGPVVGVVGSIQAQMALALLLGLAPSPLGRLVTLDAGAWRFGGFSFAGAAEPDARSAPGFTGLSALGPDDLVVDLRTECLEPVCPDAIQLALSEIDGFMPPADRRVIFACRTGLRAHHAGVALAKRWDGRIALLATP
jgi:molybdopterin/thiamine biosynthesis adenylyltransferase